MKFGLNLIYFSIDDTILPQTVSPYQMLVHSLAKKKNSFVTPLGSGASIPPPPTSKKKILVQRLKKKFGFFSVKTGTIRYRTLFRLEAFYEVIRQE